MTTTRPRRSAHSIVGRRTAELDRRIGHEVKRLRLDSGLTHRELAQAADIDPGYLSQLEHGLREPSLTVLQSIGVALGADLSVRLYPNTGPVIHDRIQAAILDALLREVASAWRRVLEAAVHRPACGVIDAVLYRPADNQFVAAEIESRIDRVEQEIRWSREKAESLPSSEVWRFAAGDRPARISRLLVVRVTRATRDLAMRYPDLLTAAYPAPALLGYPGAARRCPVAGRHPPVGRCRRRHRDNSKPATEGRPRRSVRRDGRGAAGDLGGHGAETHRPAGRFLPGGASGQPLPASLGRVSSPR